MKEEEFRDITDTLDEEEKQQLQGYRVRQVEQNQIKTFRKSLKNHISRDYFQLQGPLVLHQPRNFKFLVENLEEDNFKFQMHLPRIEPFYLSTPNHKDFLPAYFKNTQMLKEYIQYGMSQDIIKLFESISTTHRSSPLDQILIEDIIGVPSKDEKSNKFFSIAHFNLSPKSEPITVSQYQNGSQKYSSH